MPKTKAHLRSSRRAPTLRDSEIDHEISIEDHDATIDESRSSMADTGNIIHHSTSNQPLIVPDSQVPSVQPPEAKDGQPNPNADTEARPSREHDTSHTDTKDAGGSVAGKKLEPKGNGLRKSDSSNKRRPRQAKGNESAIDILYENQRGGFLCGISFFSPAALGNLDPTPWSNFAHNPSPTDITTAQVPDPSWEWAWPEWRINRDEAVQMDSDGWEYSFMFSKKFSWHGPKWYSSFVRRRVWIRRRIKKGLGYQANDPHMTNREYFSVTPTRRDADGASVDQLTARLSHETPRRSRDSRRGDEFEDEIKVDITTVGELMKVLRKSRIDRERLDAMGNYIEHCADDLHQLQDCMHEIMSLFVFQATRKLLLARLIQLHDDQVDSGDKGKSPAMKTKAENLAEAIKHADEEVRRLEYWSDIKTMAESGESRGAVDCGKGWDRTWEGLDNSGPKSVKDDAELP
ncbi:hypothetical protein F4804DRAFT_305237 [Jackrogersella minutella]|nr:hypothetical protein F4804DRAFT_305237 [Jackrogersella minutella]